MIKNKNNGGEMQTVIERKTVHKGQVLIDLPDEFEGENVEITIRRIVETKPDKSFMIYEVLNRLSEECTALNNIDPIKWQQECRADNELFGRS